MSYFFRVSFKCPGRVSAIAFILANGKQWLFGVVRVTSSKDSPKEVKECFHTPVLSFEKGEHILLMNALYVWVSTHIRYCRPTLNMLSLCRPTEVPQSLSISYPISSDILATYGHCIESNSRPLARIYFFS